MLGALRCVEKGFSPASVCFTPPKSTGYVNLAFMSAFTSASGIGRVACASGSVVLTEGWIGPRETARARAPLVVGERGPRVGSAVRVILRQPVRTCLIEVPSKLSRVYNTTDITGRERIERDRKKREVSVSLTFQTICLS